MLNSETEQMADGRTVYFGTVAPASHDLLGASPAKVGDICWSTVPSSGQPMGWVCITAGTQTAPVGTWAVFATVT